VKISSLHPTIVTVPGDRGPVTVVLVELATDEGLVGLGEAPTPIGAEPARELIASTAPLLLGQDPLQPERLKKILYLNYNLTHLHIHAACWALNAIDMALWDLLGKAAGMPLYKLWGGAFRTEIPFYGYIDYKLSADEAGAEAARLAAQGYGTIYRKIGLHEADDLACLAAIRAAIGPDVKLRVDANQSWSVGEAVEKIKRMAPFDLEYVDQPVLMYNVDELAQVRALSPVRIAAHESSWTMYEALNVIKRSAADAIHVDPRFDAGMMGARITAGMAEAAGLPTIMHHYTALGVTAAAYCQLIAAAPSFTLANQTGYAQLTDDVIAGGLMPFHQGCLRLPEGPGIGVTLDQAKVEQYAALYQRDIKGTEFSRPWMTPRYMMMQYRNFFEE